MILTLAFAVRTHNIWTASREKTCLPVCDYKTNQPAQLQRLARVLKFWIAAIILPRGIILSRRRTTKALIRLRIWQKNRFSHDVAHMEREEASTSWTYGPTLWLCRRVCMKDHKPHDDKVHFLLTRLIHGWLQVFISESYKAKIKNLNHLKTFYCPIVY